MSFNLLKYESLHTGMEGTSWDLFFESLDKMRPENDDSEGSVDIEYSTLSPLSSLRRNNASGVATLPYKKAACYGFCPTDETESLKIVKCKHCGLIVKVVGYGHHMRLRHGYRPSTASSASNSGDDCQDFLLSPPHLPMLASTSSVVSGSEFCDGSPKPGDQPGGIVTVNGTESVLCNRICSPPYYVEQCKDLVMKIPLSSSTKDDKAFNEDIITDSTHDHRTMKHRKRKSRKKEPNQFGSVSKSSTASNSRANSVRSDVPPTYEESSLLMFSSKESDFGDEESSIPFDDYLPEKLIDSNQRDMPDMDENSMFSIEYSTFSKCKRISKHKSTPNFTSVSPMGISSIKQEKLAVNRRIVAKQTNKLLDCSLSMTSSLAPVNIDAGKNTRSKGKSLCNAKKASKNDHHKNAKLEDIDDGKVNLTNIDASFFTSELHEPAKQSLSSESFTDVEYRKMMLKELEAKRMAKPKSFYHLHQNRLNWNAMHTSCSLPLSPSSESNYSSSSVSDETNSDNATNNCSITNVGIELHTMRPLMDIHSSKMRKYMLNSIESIHNRPNIQEGENVNQSRRRLRGYHENTTAIAEERSDSNDDEDEVNSSSSSSVNDNTASSSHQRSKLPGTQFSFSSLKIQPFFASKQNNNINKSTLFANSLMKAKIMNPSLRRIIKSKSSTVIEHAELNDAALDLKNLQENVESKRSVVRGVTKFVPISSNEFTETSTALSCSKPTSDLKNDDAVISNGISLTVDDVDFDPICPSSQLNEHTLSKQKHNHWDNDIMGCSSLQVRLLAPDALLQQSTQPTNLSSSVSDNDGSNSNELSNGNSNGIRQSYSLSGSFHRQQSLMSNMQQQQQQSFQACFNYSNCSNETPEQRHQRIMMMRAAQVTGGTLYRDGNSVRTDVSNSLQPKQNQHHIIPNLAKKRSYNEGSNNGSDEKLFGSNSVQFSSLPHNQQTLVKKFRPIVPRQAVVSQQRLENRNGFHTQNSKQYSVYLGNNGGSGNGIGTVKNLNEQGKINVDSTALESSQSGFKNSNVQGNYQKTPQLKGMSNFRPIAQKRPSIATSLYPTLNSLQTRYPSGLANDVTPLSGNDGLRSGNNLGHAIDYEFLPNLKMNTTLHTPLTVRRFTTNSSGGIVSNTQRDNFVAQQSHSVNYSSLSTTAATAAGPKQRSFPFSQMLLFNPNGGVNNDEGGLTDSGQYQNIEPPPVLEAEGRIADISSTPADSLSFSNVQQQQQFCDKKTSLVGTTSQYNNGGSKHINVHLLHHQNNQQQQPQQQTVLHHHQPSQASNASFQRNVLPNVMSGNNHQHHYAHHYPQQSGGQYFTTQQQQQQPSWHHSQPLFHFQQNYQQQSSNTIYGSYGDGDDGRNQF